MSSNEAKKRKIDQQDGAGGEERSSLFRGVSLEKDETSRSVVALTTGTRRDEDRWDKTTPPFDAFPNLQMIDLYKCRYLESVHQSLVQLKQLKVLRLTRCSRLKSLPDNIGLLENLEEVGYERSTF